MLAEASARWLYGGNLPVPYTNYTSHIQILAAPTEYMKTKTCSLILSVHYFLE
jgi:hypothetical protein